MSKKEDGVEEGASPSVVESGEEAIGVAVVEKVLGKRAISELDGAGGRVACFSVESWSRESGETLHFRGLSQNLESCGVPARLRTSELSAHQMPIKLSASCHRLVRRAAPKTRRAT